MEFNLGKKRGIIRFNKGFKPKSLPKFLEVYSNFGSEEELTVIFDKLNGSNRQLDKKPKRTKRSKSNKDTVSSGRASKRGDSKKE